MNNLESRLPFPDLCRVLSLQFPFPGCGDTAREDLYIFLGTAYDTFTAEHMQRIQDILDRYLDLMPAVAAPAPVPVPAPVPPVSVPPIATPSTATPSTAASSTAAPSQPAHSLEIAQYTSLLKEKGDVEGVVPQHAEVMLQETPPIWKATASYKQWVGEAQGKSKKEARHRASKDVYSIVAGR